MIPRAADPHRALARSLVEHLFPADVIIENSQQSAWASATFNGVRHNFNLKVSGEHAGKMVAKFINRLDYDEFSLHDHIVADIALTNTQYGECDTNEALTLGIEALTVQMF